MENKIKFSREEQKDFNFWKQDGNVSKNEDGSYSTQDSQWTNRLKDLDALKQYYYKEFISDTPRYAGGGRTMKNRAKKQAIKDIKSNLWRPQAPYQSVEKPSEEWERYELPYDTKLQYDFEPDSFSVQGKRYSEYSKGGEIKVNGMSKQDYIDAFQNRVEKLIEELKKEGKYDENTFDFLYEIIEKEGDGGFTDIEETGFWLSSQDVDGYDRLAYYLLIDKNDVEYRNYTEKVLSNFYFGKPMKIEFVLKTSGDTELALEDELQKIKLLSNKIDFNKVIGVIDYEKTTDNTDLYFYKDIELVMSLNGDWDETTEELDTIIDVNGETAYLNYHPLDSMGGVNMQQLKKNINEAFKELNTYSAVVSIEGYEEYAEDVEGLENAKSVIQDIKGNTRFQVLKGSSVGIGKRVDTSRVVEEFAKGGEAGFDDAGTSLAMYHETKGNWLVPKGQVYLWLYDVENSAEKIESGEFDYVQYPLTSMSMAWQRGYIPPLKRIWTKKFQKMNKGSEHLLGVIKAFLIEEDGKKELYIDMMSVNPTKKKKGVMSYMIKDLRDTFNLTQDQVTFSNLTEDGKKFVVKKTYADGGEASELNIGQIFEVNRDSEKGKKYFDFHYGKGYVFIISDIFNEKVIDENQFWDAHIKLKVYDSNLKYIFPIRVFFKGKPYGLNLTKKLFSELLSDKSIFPSDNYYVEKESDYDRQEREFKGNGYVELIKRKINPIWKSIIDKFSEIYFSNGTDNDYLVSDQVKARGSNPYSSYEFRNFSPLLSWADAEGKFKQSLTADELNSIEISYNTEEYADLEEHDTEKYHKQIVVKLKTYADGGQPVQYVPVQQMPQQPIQYVPVQQMPQQPVQYVPVQQMPQQSPQQPVNSPFGNLDINSAINFVKENPQVLSLLKDGGEASEFKKGGNVSSIEKRVAEVNALIKEGNDKGVQVIDKTTTWEAPMKYNPIKYTNGVLYVSYKQLDLYKYKKGMGSEWKNESYRIGKKELGENISRGSAQTDALSYIARMYRSAINDFNKYGYDVGGRVKTKEYFQIFKLENLLDKTELLLTEEELNRFISKWNLDNLTDYADWVEFNEYEDYKRITPVFSKNEYGGNVNNSFVESEINGVTNWENEEIASYLQMPVNEVAKNREFYVEETQNAMLVNQVDGDYADGGVTDNDLRKLLPKEKMLKLLKETKFKDFDSSKIEYIEYDTNTYNPFITNFRLTINCFPCIIIIDQISDNAYEVQIAKDDGNIAGIYKDSWEYIFEIPKLNYEEFEKGLKKVINDKIIVLYNYVDFVKTFYFVGTIEEAEKFAKKNGFKNEYDKKRGIIGFYREKNNPSLSKWESTKTYLAIGTDTKREIERSRLDNWNRSVSGGIKKLEKYDDGGDVPHADKMFQLPLEMVIYVPSTQDVDKVISVDKMDKRVDEVKIYLANKFGGYTSADKLGGFVDSTGNLVNEDVVQVTSFSTKEAYAENKEELINQLAKWGEEWGQESIGFEFEGDLMYVPQKFKQGGEVDRFSDYSNDALSDMIINLSRYENTEKEIQIVKAELEKRKGENKDVEE